MNFLSRLQQNSQLRTRDNGQSSSPKNKFANWSMTQMATGEANASRRLRRIGEIREMGSEYKEVGDCWRGFGSPMTACEERDDIQDANSHVDGKVFASGIRVEQDFTKAMFAATNTAKDNKEISNASVFLQEAVPTSNDAVFSERNLGDKGLCKGKNARLSEEVCENMEEEEKRAKEEEDEKEQVLDGVGVTGNNIGVNKNILVCKDEKIGNREKKDHYLHKIAVKFEKMKQRQDNELNGMLEGLEMASHYEKTSACCCRKYLPTEGSLVSCKQKPDGVDCHSWTSKKASNKLVTVFDDRCNKFLSRKKAKHASSCSIGFEAKQASNMTFMNREEKKGFNMEKGRNNNEDGTSFMENPVEDRSPLKDKETRDKYESPRRKTRKLRRDSPFAFPLLEEFARNWNNSFPSTFWKRQRDRYRHSTSHCKTTRADNMKH
eukprot:gene7772-8618_t